MELKRIIARDLRTATEEAIRLYGPNTLVVSSERLNGNVEVIVAADLSPEPIINSEVVMNLPKSNSKTISLSDELAKESFDEMLTKSITKNKTKSYTTRNTMKSNNNYIEENSSHPILSKEKDRYKKDKKNVEPKISEFSDFNFSDSFNNNFAANSKELENSKKVIEEKKNIIDNEALRAREIVDLVLREFSEMKKEFRLAKDAGMLQSSEQFGPHLEEVANLVKNANLPFTLQSLLLEDFSSYKDKNEAIESIFEQLLLSIQNKEVFAHQKFLKGVHVLSGPTGSGKTSTIIKLINNAVKNNLSPEKITVLSYKDNRLGAWSQIQMSCSKFGVELFKVSDLDFLETIQEELVSKDLVLIDTSSNLSNESLAEISKVISDAYFHLVLPVDSSITVFKHFLKKANINWNNIINTKFDESVAPWGFLQEMLNGKVPVSSICFNGSSAEDYFMFNMKKFVMRILEIIFSSGNCKDLTMNLKQIGENNIVNMKEKNEY